MSSKQTETPSEKLDRLRAEVASHQRADTTVPVVQAGDVIHALATGLSISRTASIWGGLPPLLLTRGDRIVVTEEMVAADRDRHGRPGWTSMVHDPDRQLRRWGKVFLAPGEPPEGIEPWELGSPEWAEARETARKAAWNEPNPQRRAVALDDVQRVYGAAPTTSTITATIKGDADYDAQQQRIAASATTGSPNVGPSRAGR